MLIPISLSAEKTIQFLEYFNLAIRKGGHEGSSISYLPDGSVAETVRCALAASSDTNIPASWTITLKADGILAPLRIDVDDAAPDGWQRAAEGVVREALVSVLESPKTKVFCREEFAYIGQPLDGEYYILNFRIAPSQPAFDDPFGFSENILLIDHYAEGVGGLQAHALGKVQAQKIASLLCVFLNAGFHKIPTTEHRWVYDAEGNTSCLQLGYRSSLPKPVSMPRKGTECRPGQAFEVNRDEMEDALPRPVEFIRCPKDIRVLFSAYNALPPNEQVAYLGAAALFQIALTAGRNYPTVEMAYSVAAVDALARGKQQSTKMFVQLVKDCCPNVPSQDVEYLYQRIRSAHFHVGSFPGGEFEPVNFGQLLVLRNDELKRHNLRWYTRAVMRFVLIRWLFKQAQG